MARVAAKLGVEIRLSEPVEEIEFQGRRPSGVYTPARYHPCDALVINADFARAMTKLVPNKLRRRWTNTKLRAKRFSCSTFMLYLGVKGKYDDVKHHTVYISKDYEGNLRDIENSHTIPHDPSFYAQNACVTDRLARSRGDEHDLRTIPVSHQHPNIDWTKESDGFRRLALRQLEP